MDIAGRLAVWVVGLCASLAALPARAADTAIEAQSRALMRASDAVLGLRTLAVQDARSAATLGSARQGSGVLIDDALVLTIGYLVLESDIVELVTDDERHIPARVLGYDVATGFGLVQALTPIQRAPVPLGEAASLLSDEPLVVVSGGADGEVGSARLLSRRAFSGYWEYHIEGALFTSPPRTDHSGAALFNLRGELVGIGSLVVNDALGADAGAVPGNMFVPIDLLKPILREMRERGSSRASERAWIGLNCIETAGLLRVVRVTDDSPADVAGLLAGDEIVRIDGMPVQKLSALWKQLWAGNSAEREVRLDIQRDGKAQVMTLQSVDRAKTLRRAQGI